MLLNRQKQMLVLLNAFGGELDNLDFQKLLFLYNQELDVPAAYEFVPYYYGAFSFSSYADRRKLVGKGYLEDDEKYWRLTDKGKTSVEGMHSRSLSSFVERHRNLHGDALVAETYRRFPYFAARSRILQRVLADDADTLRAIEKERPRFMTGAIFTIGYEGLSLEGYANRLLRSGVTILCDVRRNAISRKYGFSKSTLKRSCEGVGIRYEHVPDLGIESEKRRDLKAQADYDALFQIYRREELPRQGKAIEKIADWIRSGERVALTCYEKLPIQCHRHCVADAVESHLKKSYRVEHL